LDILITGGTGFVGRALDSALRAKGHNPVCLGAKDCDLTRQDSLARFNDKKYEYIYHLAAWSRAGDFCRLHPGEQWIINQQINTNVLSWWQKDQPQAKLICPGTSLSYDAQQEMSEENYLKGIPHLDYFTYAMTKRMLYVGILALEKQFGLKYLHLVPDTLYGPDYHTDGRPMHFIYDLIKKIMRGKLYGEPVTLWGDGSEQRELVLVGDFIQIMLRLLPLCENETVNIAKGQAFPIRGYARIICERIGYDFNKVKFDASRSLGTASRCLAVSKLRRILPDAAFIPLESGLDKTIEWFQKEKDKLL